MMHCVRTKNISCSRDVSVTVFKKAYSCSIDQSSVILLMMMKLINNETKFVRMLAGQHSFTRVIGNIVVSLLITLKIVDEQKTINQ